MSQFEEKAREFKEIAREIGQEYGSACLEAEVSLALGEAFEAGRNSMCQADLGAKCGDGVAPGGALQPGSSADAEMDAEIVGMLRGTCREIFGGNCAYADDDLKILAACSRWAVANGIPDEICPNVIPKAKALLRGERHLGAYGGNPDFITSALENAAISQSLDEEPALAGDEVDAASASASLTQEITSLRSQLETLKEALEPFAETLNGSDPHLPDEFDLQDLWAAEELTVGDLRRARAALNTPENADSASVTAEEASEATSVGPNPSDRL